MFFYKLYMNSNKFYTINKLMFELKPKGDLYVYMDGKHYYT